MYTITMSTAPMASGAIGVPPSTDSPIVRTRKNVPMSSVRYLFICLLLRVWRRQRSRDGSEPLVESRAPENARESVHRPPQLSASVHHAVHVRSQRLALHDADGARGNRILHETSVSRWPAGGRFARATTIIRAVDQEQSACLAILERSRICVATFQ